MLQLSIGFTFFLHGKSADAILHVQGMLWETSLLDPEEGIRFRGFSIPELQVTFCNVPGRQSLSLHASSLGWQTRIKCWLLC